MTVFTGAAALCAGMCHDSGRATKQSTITQNLMERQFISLVPFQKWRNFNPLETLSLMLPKWYRALCGDSMICGVGGYKNDSLAPRACKFHLYYRLVLEMNHRKRGCRQLQLPFKCRASRIKF